MALDLITARKCAQGYVAPAHRDGCRNCRHRSDEALRYDSGHIAYDRTLGRFFVVPGGICNQYQRADIARWPVKETAR